MKIESINVAMQGGQSYLLPIEAGTLSALIKDALLSHLLSSNELPTNEINVVNKVANHQAKSDDIPILEWCAYTAKRLQPESTQMCVRLAVIDYFSRMAMWGFKPEIVSYLQKIFTSLKPTTIHTYVMGMVKAGVLERKGSDNAVLRLSEEFKKVNLNGEVS